MTLWTLTFTLLFVVLAMGISMWQKLGLEKDMVIATVRATVQLLIIGYILKAVFSLNNVIFTVLMLTLMIVVAAQNASRRGKGLKGTFWRLFAGIAITEIVTQAILLSFHVIPSKPSYVIPISGMIIGNSMVASGLFLNRLKAETQSQRQQILVLLSLGASPKQASRAVLKRAIKSSMIPTIDSTKTMGLVQLPGMMTGQIIAGANPVQAVRYQLLIVFAIIASAAITSMVVGFLTYPLLFNKRWQLVLSADE